MNDRDHYPRIFELIVRVVGLLVTLYAVAEIGEASVLRVFSTVWITRDEMTSRAIAVFHLLVGVILMLTADVLARLLYRKSRE